MAMTLEDARTVTSAILAVWPTPEPPAIWAAVTAEALVSSDMSREEALKAVVSLSASDQPWRPRVGDMLIVSGFLKAAKELKSEQTELVDQAMTVLSRKGWEAALRDTTGDIRILLGSVSQQPNYRTLSHEDVDRALLRTVRHLGLPSSPEDTQWILDAHVGRPSVSSGEDAQEG